MRPSSTTSDSAADDAAARSSRWTVRRALRMSDGAARRLAAAIVIVTLLAARSGHVSWVTAVVAIALVPAVLVDLRIHRLPNRLVGGAALAGVAAALTAVATGQDLHVIDAALGAAAMAAPLLLAHLVSPASMGFGDVKLAAVLGAGLGVGDPIHALIALAAGAAITVLHGLVTRRRTVPFGPGLLVGAVLTVAATATGSDPALLPPSNPTIDASAAVTDAGRTATT
ncbi:MAG: prepilin peptidase [Ilumatobacter sp.]